MNPSAPVSLMLTREAIRGALRDAIAESGVTDAEILRRAGLDRSYLVPAHSHPWPNMATIAALLEAANVALPRFAEMVEARMQLMQKDMAA